jgi:hypothetical protein
VHIAVSKIFFPAGNVRVQLRADLINASNHRQWLTDPTAIGLDNTCTRAVTSCTAPDDQFGQLLEPRAPREIQLGVKVSF